MGKSAVIRSLAVIIAVLVLVAAGMEVVSFNLNMDGDYRKAIWITPNTRFILCPFIARGFSPVEILIPDVLGLPPAQLELIHPNFRLVVLRKYTRILWFQFEEWDRVKQ